MYCLVLLATPSGALRPPPLLVLPHSEQNEAIVGSDSDAAGPLDVLEHGVAQHRHSNGEHALEHDLIEVSLRQGPHRWHVHRHWASRNRNPGTGT
jgi:hypothetical protein